MAAAAAPQAAQSKAPPLPEKPQALQAHSGSILDVADSHNAQRIASGSDDKTICVWSSESGRLLTQIKQHTDYVRSTGAPTAACCLDPTTRLRASSSCQPMAARRNSCASSSLTSRWGACGG